MTDEEIFGKYYGPPYHIISDIKKDVLVIATENLDIESLEGLALEKTNLHGACTVYRRGPTGYVIRILDTRPDSNAYTGLYGLDQAICLARKENKYMICVDRDASPAKKLRIYKYLKGAGGKLCPIPRR